jgi:hypothetical protein
MKTIGISRQRRLNSRCRSESPAAVPTDSDHHGVVQVVAFFSNHPIEISHQPDMHQRTQLPLHDLS